MNFNNFTELYASLEKTSSSYPWHQSPNSSESEPYKCWAFGGLRNAGLFE